MALKNWYCLTHSQGECAFSTRSILTEPPHLRQDDCRPADVVALGKGFRRKDTAMDCVIVSGLTKSYLTNKSKSSDFYLRMAEKVTFCKHRRPNCPLASSANMRFIPLAVNHVGLRGPHFQVVLREFDASLVTNPAGFPF